MHSTNESVAKERPEEGRKDRSPWNRKGWKKRKERQKGGKVSINATCDMHRVDCKAGGARLICLFGNYLHRKGRVAGGGGGGG